MNSMYSARVMNLIKNNINICNWMLKEKFDNSSGNFDINIEKMHTCYKNILDAFTLFKKTLQTAVRFL